jgi:hypothetical protein
MFNFHLQATICRRRQYPLLRTNSWIHQSPVLGTNKRRQQSLVLSTKSRRQKSLVLTTNSRRKQSHVFQEPTLGSYNSLLFRLQPIEEFNPPLIQTSTLTAFFNLQNSIYSFGILFCLDILIKSSSPTFSQHIFLFI